MKPFFTFIICLSVVGSVKAQFPVVDYLYEFNFSTTNPDPVIFPDVTKYGAGKKEGYLWWNESSRTYYRADPVALTLYEGALESKQLNFKVIKSMNTGTIYDSIKLSMVPSHPFSYIQSDPKYTYEQSTSVTGKRYRFKSYVYPNQNHHAFGKALVLCRNCSSFDADVALDVFVNITNAKLYFGNLTVEVYNSATASFSYQETVTSMELQGALLPVTIEPNMSMDAKYRFCSLCKNYVMSREFGSNGDQVYNDCVNNPWVGDSYIYYSSIKLAIPVSGIIIEGYKEGLATNLTNSAGAPEEDEILKLYDLTGKEVSVSSVGNPVIAVYKNGARKLIRIDQ